MTGIEYLPFASFFHICFQFCADSLLNFACLLTAPYSSSPCSLMNLLPNNLFCYGASSLLGLSFTLRSFSSTQILRLCKSRGATFPSS